MHPDAVERCNGRDDDCDGAGDEGAVDTETWFEDVDADGFGGTGSWLACDRPPGFVGNSSDCDDRSAAVNPDAGELCNGVDDDCDAVIDEEVCP